MNNKTNPVDLSKVIKADRANVWHHLSQHKLLETSDPLLVVKGEGMYLFDADGKSHLDATSGGLWTVKQYTIN